MHFEIRCYDGDTCIDVQYGAMQDMVKMAKYWLDIEAGYTVKVPSDKAKVFKEKLDLIRNK